MMTLLHIDTLHFGSGPLYAPCVCLSACPSIKTWLRDICDGTELRRLYGEIYVCLTNNIPGTCCYTGCADIFTFWIVDSFYYWRRGGRAGKSPRTLYSVHYPQHRRGVYNTNDRFQTKSFPPWKHRFCQSTEPVFILKKIIFSWRNTAFFIIFSACLDIFRPGSASLHRI